MAREDIEFRGEGGALLRGWFYPAEGVQGPAPAIVLAHGLSAVKEMHLDSFARYFAAAGFAVVAYDHQNFGASEGTPRQEADPVLQSRDIRNAITYAMTRDEVDADRIGIWGSSFAGGQVIMVAATDRRVKAVVAQVPGVSGSAMLMRNLRPDFVSHALAQLDADRMHRFNGGEPNAMPAVAPNPFDQAVMPQTETYEWFTEAAKSAPNWRNELTVRSMELVLGFEPGSYISRVSPTPLMMVVADNDTVAPFQIALDAYHEAREPKDLRLFHGGHFDVYEGEGFDFAAGAAREHFLTHLK